MRKKVYFAIIVFASISGKNVFIVEVINLVTTKVIKHRVNGWDPCEQHCEALLPFRQTSLWSRGEQHGVDGPFVNRSLTLKAASVVRDAHTQDFRIRSLRVQKLAESRLQQANRIILLTCYEKTEFKFLHFEN